MSYKTNSGKSKSCCDRFDKHRNLFIRSDKGSRKVVAPKKVILSKKLHNSNEAKSCSTGIIARAKNTNEKKTTQSDFGISKCTGKRPQIIDYCEKCGDSADQSEYFGNNKREIDMYSATIEQTAPGKEDLTKEKAKKATIFVSSNEKARSVQQYYKNENFKTESVQDIGNGFRKSTLDTIKEMNEKQMNSLESSSKKNSEVFRVYTDSEIEDEKSLEVDSDDCLRRLIQFRRDNYFECHSSQSRIKNKASVIDLKNHRCGYRFYLNERLFPVPLCTDYKDTIRCVECHLPLELDKSSLESDRKKNVNGTIQAKVRFGNDNTQDLMLLLPAKEPLIIKEKRRQRMNKKEKEVLYFGVIKLSASGDSIFNPTTPCDSLALRYQKGFRQLADVPDYRYDDRVKTNDNEIVIV